MFFRLPVIPLICSLITITVTDFSLYPSGTVKESLARLNVPVRCGGIQVRPGDIVFGDCDGVVVIPQEHEDEVFQKALAKYDHEQEIIKELEAGKTTLEIYGFDKIIEQK